MRGIFLRGVIKRLKYKVGYFMTWHEIGLSSIYEILNFRETLQKDWCRSSIM